MNKAELVEAIQKALGKDATKRAEMYGEIQRKHRETSSFVLMFQHARQDAVRSNVKGF